MKNLIHRFAAAALSFSIAVCPVITCAEASERTEITVPMESTEAAAAAESADIGSPAASLPDLPENAAASDASPAADSVPQTSERAEIEADDSGPDSMVSAAVSEEAEVSFPIYRLYNPNSGEHFYTKTTAERNTLVYAGWRYEGVGWVVPETSGMPVYRLYNPNAGDHHYTANVSERDFLTAAGWRYEGIGWYADDQKRVPVYREYNPNAKSGAHNFTTSESEHDRLVGIGWRGEGTAWYAQGVGYSDPVDFNSVSASDFTIRETGENGTWRISIRLSTNGHINQVQFPAWTPVSGQDDITWYKAEYDPSSDVWYKDFNLWNDHWNGTALTAHCYVTLNRRSAKRVAAASVSFSENEISQIVDHRGNWSAAPENSKPAFRNVTDYACETDIRETKDGKWVVMHDTSVDRTTDGTGAIEEKTFAGVQQLLIDAGANVSSYRISDRRVPTLEEYLDICSAKGVVPVIEIKYESHTDAAYDTLISELKKRNLLDKCSVISFHAAP